MELLAGEFFQQMKALRTKVSFFEDNGAMLDSKVGPFLAKNRSQNVPRETDFLLVIDAFFLSNLTPHNIDSQIQQKKILLQF